MKLDDILREVGEFGRYQKRLYFFTCVPAMTIGSLILLNVIVFGVPEHRCKIPGLDNDTWNVKSSAHQALVNYYIPPSDKYPYDRCHLYEHGNVTVFSSSNVTMNASAVLCKEWVYDTSVFESTFTKEVNLVCGKALLISDAQTVYYFGVLVGSIVLGQLSDLLGRKKSLYAGLIGLMISTISLTFSTTFYSFVVIYFMMGFCSMSSFMTAFVIGMEFAGPSKRIWAGNIIHFIGATGSLYLVLMSYLLRDWKKIELSVGIPCIIYIIYICIIPESPRWLLSKGKLEEATRIITKLAEVNGKQLPDRIISSFESDIGKTKGRVWQLFSTRVLAFRTIVIIINWFVVSMTYYGVVLSVGNLGGNFYLNLFLMTVADYPAKLLTLALLDRIGRKRMYVFYMLTCAIVCIGTIYPVLEKRESLHWLLVTLAVIGKTCASTGFEVLYIFSSELFPTVVRNVGMGSSSAFARAGSMLSPYIAQMGDLNDSSVATAVPMTIFGVAALIGGLLSLTLPETVNKLLPDTIDEANDYTRDSCNTQQNAS